MSSRTWWRALGALLTLFVASAASLAAQGTSGRMMCGAWRGDSSNGTWCTLVHDDTIFGRTLPAGSNVRYDAHGTLRYFVVHRATTFDGMPLAGTSDGPHHELYADGRPQRLWLAAAHPVQGVPCRAVSVWREIVGRSSVVVFHPNGRLRQCRLARRTNIQGRDLPSGALVIFDSAGTLLAN
jgi:hypothetical protein